MPTPEQTIGDPISHEPDWEEWLDACNCYCWRCHGTMVFQSYDSISREVEAHCLSCGQVEKYSTDPDPDTAHDREAPNVQ